MQLPPIDGVPQGLNRERRAWAASRRHPREEPAQLWQADRLLNGERCIFFGVPVAIWRQSETPHLLSMGVRQGRQSLGERLRNRFAVDIVSQVPIGWQFKFHGRS